MSLGLVASGVSIVWFEVASRNIQNVRAHIIK